MDHNKYRREDADELALETETAYGASALLELGLPLVPLRPVFFEGGVGVCNCDNPTCKPGKHPVTVGWQAVETRDRRLMEPDYWLSHRALGVGIVTGLWVPNLGGYLHVLDFDVGPGKPGLESRGELEKRLGELPPTVGVRTGSGGVQEYFVVPTELPCSTGRRSEGGSLVGLAPAVDTRGRGGFVVAPPSMHRSGNRYAWLPGRSPWHMDIAPLPPAWVEACQGAGARPIERRLAPCAVHAGSSRYPLRYSRQVCRAMVEHPAWRWATENPNDVDRLTWVGFANNLGCAVDGHEQLVELGREAFRNLSEGYDGYQEQEADRVFDEAVRWVAKGGGPSAWEKMEAVPERLRASEKNLVQAVRGAVRGGGL